MPDAKTVVAQAFDDWSTGRDHVGRIFADRMTWEIVGRSAGAGVYADKRQFVDEVLSPFAALFDEADPFRPVRIRSITADDDTVAVTWDGLGTTKAGTRYENTYAWILRVEDGLVVDGTAFFDSIAFDELWALRG